MIETPNKSPEDEINQITEIISEPDVQTDDSNYTDDSLQKAEDDLMKEIEKKNEKIIDNENISNTDDENFIQI